MTAEERQQIREEVEFIRRRLIGEEAVPLVKDGPVDKLCGLALTALAALAREARMSENNDWVELREMREMAADEYQTEIARLRTALAQAVEALERSPHRRDCTINPGGRIMEALGEPTPRPCSCGRDAALAAAQKVLK